MRANKGIQRIANKPAPADARRYAGNNHLTKLI
jgi:hypothetical protein